MINIIKTELFRIKKSVLFWVLLALSFASSVLSFALSTSILTVSEISFYESMQLLKAEGETYLALSELCQYLSDSGLFTLICVAVFLSKEFTTGTIRNVVLSNKSRTQTFFAFLITALFISLCYVTAYLVGTLLSFGIFVGFDASVSTAVTAVLSSYLLGICACSFVACCVVMFLFVTGKQSSAIIYPLLLLILVPAIVEVIVLFSQIGSIFDGVLEYQANSVYSWVPFYNKGLFDASNFEMSLVGKIVMYDVVFSVICALIGWLKFRQADLK